MKYRSKHRIEGLIYLVTWWTDFLQFQRFSQLLDWTLLLLQFRQWSWRKLVEQNFWPLKTGIHPSVWRGFSIDWALQRLWNLLIRISLFRCLVLELMFSLKYSQILVDRLWCKICMCEQWKCRFHKWASDTWYFHFLSHNLRIDNSYLQYYASSR